MSNWISVKDRLPEEYVDVLITDGHRVHIGGWFGRVRAESNAPYWLPCTQDIGELDVTHWMELPKPPEA